MMTLIAYIVICWS